ncbi:MAG TPA: HAD family hydrolase [Longimicrobiales bacterium]
MPQRFLVVAVDYDGTIAQEDRADQAALDAIAALRSHGRKVLLCTGRMLEELRTVFPDVDRHFDAIVAENGGVIVMSSEVSYLEEPLPAELAAALDHAQIPYRTGHVLLATDAVFDVVVLREIERLGLEAQLVYNRGALMVLPAGVSKGAGLIHALGRLELSRHSTIAIGDAENDHSLLHSCEIGVAVANAVPGLRIHADVCLDEPNGAGVAAFLRGPVLRDEVEIHPGRWHVELGRSADDEPARLPGSRINVLIAGASCSGKSHLAGLFIERLVALDYTVCVLDAEGDHATLDRLPGVITVGGTEPLPPAARLAGLVRNRFSSVVADLSLLEPAQKREFCHTALAALHELRLDRGFPHWIVIEEADQLLAGGELPVEPGARPPVGYCFITHRPASLNAQVLSTLDAVVALPGAERYARIPFLEPDAAAEAEPFLLQTGEALLAAGGRLLRFETAPRALPHVRHQHKYMYAQVPAERRFFFGSAGGHGAAAGNVAEFGCEIGRAPGDVLRAHLLAGDFSRWTHDVLADDELGGRLRGVERWFRTDPDADPEAARTAVMSAIRDRYSDPAEVIRLSDAAAPPSERSAT